MAYGVGGWLPAPFCIPTAGHRRKGKAMKKNLVTGNIYCGDAFYEKEYDYKKGII